MSRTTQARSELGLAVKDRRKRPTSENAEREQQARRALAEAKISEFVERTVAAAPELLPEQKQRLSALFTAVK